MRLINVDTLKIHDFIGSRTPKYAILSHRWGEEELSYQDYQDPTKRKGNGYQKIADFCRLLQETDHLRNHEGSVIEWAWVDTCCIDKRSSAELSEAINSMFKWYNEAKFCVAYLADVPYRRLRETLLSDLLKSNWFSRGWTLQELLAPRKVYFYTSGWDSIGTRDTDDDVASVIQQATKISLFELRNFNGGSGRPSRASVAQRMSWAAKRKTTRSEDLSYCLMGLFNVNMPLLYGEGSRAFWRLQEHIISQSDDESILAWKNDSPDAALADDPSFFRNCGNIFTTTRVSRLPMEITNRGLLFTSPATEIESHDGCRRFVVKLNCANLSASNFAQGCLWVLQEWPTQGGVYLRAEPNVEEVLTTITPALAREKVRKGKWVHHKKIRLCVALRYEEFLHHRNIYNDVDAKHITFDDGDEPYFNGFVSASRSRS